MEKLTNKVLTKGIHTDNKPIAQPDNTIRYALNAIKESSEGDQTSYSNELGNIVCADLTIDTVEYTPIGFISLPDNKTVLFLAHPSSGEDKIVIQEDCELTTVLSHSCLNFSVNHQIHGFARIRKGCNRTIYFTDNYNPLRSIDLDDLDIYNNSVGVFDCSLIEHFPPFEEPCIHLVTTYNSGGNNTINVGAFSLIISYADDDLNSTNWFTQSPVIAVIDENYGTDYDQLDGAVNQTTNKSFEFRISNIDTRYKYLNIGFVEYATETGEASAAYMVESVRIENNSTLYLFRGIDENSSTELDLSEVRVPTMNYSSVKTIEQYDNRLILGNLKTNSIDHTAFIREALKIKAFYFTGPKANANSTADGRSPSTPSHYFDTRGYMRDEVYAFGIVWVFKNGTESPVYHIPGRKKGHTRNGDWIHFVNNDEPNDHNRPGFSGNWDRDIDWSINATEQTANTIHLVNNPSPERWQVCNTAIRTVGPSSTNINGTGNTQNGTVFTTDSFSHHKDQYRFSQGELAYYESTNTYPEEVDCNGDAVYGDLAGEPLRFHRMPDTTLEPHFLGYDQTQYPLTTTNPDPTVDGNGSAYVINLGVEFENINVPSTVDASLIIGYKIVRSQRSIQNRTVVDKGLLEKNRVYVWGEGLNGLTTGSNDWQFMTQNDLTGELSQGSSTIGNGVLGHGWVALGDEGHCESTNPHPSPNFHDIDAISYSIHTPFTKFYTSDGGADYIKIERVVGGDYEISSGGGGANERSYIRFLRSGVPLRYRINRTIRNAAFIDADSLLPDGILSREFVNYNQQETFAVDVNYEIEGTTDTNTYKLTNTLDGTFDATPNVDNFLHTRHYVALKVNNQNIYGNLHNIEYIPVSKCVVKSSTNSTYVYGGDTTIARFAFRQYLMTKGCGYFQTSDGGYAARILDFWAESPINSELRHTQDITVAGDWYYPKNFSSWAPFLNLENDQNTAAVIPNTYYYNKDYSAERNVKVSFPLPQTYKYCNNCNNEFPHRIVWSQKADQEQLHDPYKIFEANDYRNIPGQTGEISHIFYLGKTFYSRTEESLWRVHTSDQQLKTDIATVNLGTGEFMTLPPVELITTDEIFGGTKYQWSDYQTQYGHLYASPESGKVFMLTQDGELKEISSQGNRNWFEEHLPIQFTKQYQDLTDTEYPYDNNPVYKNGIGILATYDSRYRRYILTKKDYRFLEESHTFDGINNYSDMFFTYGTQTTPVVYVGDGDYTSPLSTTNNSKAGQFYVYQTVNGAVGSTPIDFPNGLYFENLSWTISFSFKDNAWISWHSYLPNFYHNNNDTFFSYINPAVVSVPYTWKHNTGEFQHYYGFKHDHILECILNPDPLNTHYFSNLHWLSSVSALSTNTNQYYDVHNITFDRLVAYNEHQCTGLQTVDVMNDDEPYKLIDYSGDTLHARRTNRNWKVSKLRDYVYSYTDHFFTKHWMLTRPDYPIDKVLNNNMISHTKDQYQLSGLKDKWLGVRLFFKPRDNYKITTDICKTILLQDFR